MTRALYLNAVLLAVIAVALIWRNGSTSIESPAFAQQQPVIGGGAGVFIVPAQFSTNEWGCYLMDIDSQNIVAYVYQPGRRTLQFVAARNYRFDRKLEAFNTTPLPREVEDLVKKQTEAKRDAERNK